MVSGVGDVIAARGVSLDGGDLPGIVRLRGNVNRRDVSIDGVDYDAGTLVFKGFCGVREPDGTLHGEYRFRLAQPGDEENDWFDFTALPSWPNAVIVLP